jgi:chemotaxis protein methyltransferase CheR
MREEPPAPIAPPIAAPVPRFEEPAPDPLAAARSAFDAGDYDRVVGLTANDASVDGNALRVRAIANAGDPRAAADACAEAVRAQALSPELHLLHAALLMDTGHDEAAARAARKALYLEPTLAVGHFLLGTILRRTGDARGAARAYRNACALATSLAPTALLPFGDGQSAGGLAEAARAQIELLDRASSRAGEAAR